MCLKIFKSHKESSLMKIFIYIITYIILQKNLDLEKKMNDENFLFEQLNQCNRFNTYYEICSDKYI